MKKCADWKFLGLAFCLSALPLLAQTTLNISGKVTGSDGVGLEGVTVSLAGLKNTAVTGADGTYHLTGTATLTRFDGKGPNALSFNDHLLSFNVPSENTSVHVEVFNLVGKTLAVLVDGKLHKGNYRINPFAAGAIAHLDSHLAFLSVKIGSDAYTLK